MNKYYSLYVILAFLFFTAILVVFIPQSQYVDGAISFVNDDKNIFYELINAPINGFIGIDNGDSISYTNSGVLAGVASLSLLILSIFSYTYIILKTQILEKFLSSHADFVNKHLNIFIFIIISFFVAGAYTHGMYETTIGLSVALFAIFSKLGFDKIYVTKLILYSTSIGYMTSTINPFATGLASELAGVSLSEGFLTRSILFIILFIYTVFHLLKIKDNYKIEDGVLVKTEEKSYNIDFVLFVIPFIYLSYSYLPFELSYQLDMNGLILLFILFSLYFGYKYFRSISQTIGYFLEAFTKCLVIIVVLSISRGIYVLLVNTQVVDTIIYYFTNLLSNFNLPIIVILLFIFYMLLSTLISSSSAVALISIPILSQTFVNLGINQGLLITIYQSAIGLLHIFSITSVVVLMFIAESNLTYFGWIKECYKYVISVGVIAILVILISLFFM